MTVLEIRQLVSSDLGCRDTPVIDVDEQLETLVRIGQVDEHAAVRALFDNPFIGCWRLRWAGTSRRPGHWVCCLEPSEPSIVVLSLPNDVGILLDDRTERIKENALITGLGVIGEADDIPIIVIVDPET